MLFIRIIWGRNLKFLSIKFFLRQENVIKVLLLSFCIDEGGTTLMMAIIHMHVWVQDFYLYAKSIFNSEQFPSTCKDHLDYVYQTEGFGYSTYIYVYIYTHIYLWHLISGLSPFSWAEISNHSSIFLLLCEPDCLWSNRNAFPLWENVLVWESLEWL